MMEVTLVRLLSISLFLETVSGGQYRAISPTQPIEAVEGDAVTLQCRLDPPVNLFALTVDWKRGDNKDVVHSYRHKQDHLHPQTDQYRNRTTLNREDLIRGILSLQISSVQLSDSGPYRCFIPKLWTSCVIDLIIVDQQNETQRNDSSTTGPPEEQVTESGGRDGGNGLVVAGTISTVVGILCVLIVVLVLRMSGTIQKCMKRLRGRKEQKSETAFNRSEMRKVNTQAADGEADLEDLERPAENIV